MLLRMRTSAVKAGGGGYKEDEEMADEQEDEEMADEQGALQERLSVLYERFQKRGTYLASAGEGTGWGRVALQGRGRMGTYPSLECKAFARLLDLLDTRGVNPFHLTARRLLDCQPESALKNQHPTWIIWVDDGRKPSIREVKESIGEDYMMVLPMAKGPQPNITCRGFDFNTVIYHEDAIKFLEDNYPDGFRTYKWVPNLSAESRDRELRCLELLREEARRERLSPAQCICEDGLLRISREHGTRITWRVDDNKFKPCKCRYVDFFRRLLNPLVKKTTLQASLKMDGWGIFLDVWKPAGEELKFHFETMRGVEADRHPVMRHLKHVLRPEHLMHSSEPWRDGMHVKIKFELVGFPGNFAPDEVEHEVGYSYVERVGVINAAVRLHTELHNLKGVAVPNFDGMPRLWVYPLDLVFLGFNGKQEFLSEYQGACSWGVNLPLDVQVNLLDTLFPVGVGADSPIRKVPRRLMRILEDTEADGDLRTEDRILSKARSLLTATRKNFKEGLVFSVCAWDVMPHHPRSFQIFEPRGTEPLRRLRTQVKAKPLVNIHLRVSTQPEEPNCIFLMDNVVGGPFVHKVYRNGDKDGMRHIETTFFDSLVAAVGRGESPVIKVEANGITERPSAGQDGRRYVLSGVLYIRESSLKKVDPSCVREVYNDLNQNGHQLKCAAARKMVDKWAKEHPLAEQPLKKLEDLLLAFKRDSAMGGKGK